MAGFASLCHVSLIKMANTVEIQVIIDDKGIKCIRIVGSSEVHKAGHKMYFQLLDLIDNFDKAIQQRLRQGEENENPNNRGFNTENA